MIDDSMKSNRIIGMIQPKKSGDLKKPDLSSMMDKASIAAALNCKKIGCNPPSREDIEIFINKENFENNA